MWHNSAALDVFAETMNEIPSSADTLQVPLARFASMACSMAWESIVLGAPDIA